NEDRGVVAQNQGDAVLRQRVAGRLPVELHGSPGTLSPDRNTHEAHPSPRGFRRLASLFAFTVGGHHPATLRQKRCEIFRKCLEPPMSSGDATSAENANGSSHARYPHTAPVRLSTLGIVMTKIRKSSSGDHRSMY